MPDIADKYQLPDYVTKRLRYFDGQFLKEDQVVPVQVDVLPPAGANDTYGFGHPAGKA